METVKADGSIRHLEVTGILPGMVLFEGEVLQPVLGATAIDCLGIHSVSGSPAPAR